MSEQKKQVVFAPGAFDSFEGTQEELDALQQEIVEMFANMTDEELRAQSRPIDLDELREDGEDELADVLAGLDNNQRNLQ